MAASPLQRIRWCELERSCVSPSVPERLVAFVVLGKQPRGEPCATDDCDLLQGICRHAEALLSHASLAEERQASAELEALHRFSVFCLHDLKNPAVRLFLVAQNAEHHGHDPAFQEEAIHLGLARRDVVLHMLLRV